MAHVMVEVGNSLAISQKVMSSIHQVSSQPKPQDPLMPDLVNLPVDLHPAEDFFHLLADPLTDPVGFIPGRSAVNRRTPRRSVLAARWGGGDLPGPNDPLSHALLLSPIVIASPTRVVFRNK
jgi:hypothetical protein